MSSELSTSLSRVSPRLCRLPGSLLWYAPPPFFPRLAFFFFFNSTQTSRACGWIWLESAVCLQALSEEGPSGHCHGNSDNPEVCRCGHPGLSEGASPSPASELGVRSIYLCLPPLSFPVIFLLKQKQIPIFNIYYQNPGLNNIYQKLHL